MRQERIAKYADAFQLTGSLGSAVGGYSHGMKQKLALISALMRKPRLLILDEPFVGLDPAASHLLKGYLAELCAGRRRRVLFHPRAGRWLKSSATGSPSSRTAAWCSQGATAELVGDSTLEEVFLELEGASQP